MAPFCGALHGASEVYHGSIDPTVHTLTWVYPLSFLYCDGPPKSLTSSDELGCGPSMVMVMVVVVVVLIHVYPPPFSYNSVFFFSLL